MTKPKSLLFFQLIVFAVVVALATCAIRRATETTTDPAADKGGVFTQALLAAKGK